jgi:DNA/RNA-binding protein KIN17
LKDSLRSACGQGLREQTTLACVKRRHLSSMSAYTCTCACIVPCDVLQEFESSFLELLRRAHPFSRVAAKNVYNDFIADKSVAAMPARKCFWCNVPWQQISRQSSGHARCNAFHRGSQSHCSQCRHHVHMNATKWLTLTEFVKHLGKEGKCRVDETPKGWFISLIQADPMAELSAERRVKRDRRDLISLMPARVHRCM